MYCSTSNVPKPPDSEETFPRDSDATLPNIRKYYCRTSETLRIITKVQFDSDATLPIIRQFGQNSEIGGCKIPTTRPVLLAGNDSCCDAWFIFGSKRTTNDKASSSTEKQANNINHKNNKKVSVVGYPNCRGHNNFKEWVPGACKQPEKLSR